MTLLWRRGETAEAAIERVRAITPDPEAGRAARDAMLPAFEGISEWVPLPIRQALVPRVEAGALEIARVELADAAPRDATALRYVDLRWGTRSAQRRAGLAVLALVEDEGRDPLAVRMLSENVSHRVAATVVVSFAWRRVIDMQDALSDPSIAEWIEVVRPTLSHPLVALRLRAIDRAALAAERWF